MRSKSQRDGRSAPAVPCGTLPASHCKPSDEALGYFQERFVNKPDGHGFKDGSVSARWGRLRRDQRGINAQRPTSNAQLPKQETLRARSSALRHSTFVIRHSSFALPPWALDVGRWALKCLPVLSRPLRGFAFRLRSFPGRRSCLACPGLACLRAFGPQRVHPDSQRACGGLNSEVRTWKNGRTFSQIVLPPTLPLQPRTIHAELHEAPVVHFRHVRRATVCAAEADVRGTRAEHFDFPQHFAGG